MNTLVVGWLTTLLLGVMAKILPHLAYNTLARTRPAFAALGTPNKVLREDWQHASVVLVGAGWMALVSSIVLGAPLAAQCAAAVWSAGIALVIANNLRILALARPLGAPSAASAPKAVATR